MVRLDPYEMCDQCGEMGVVRSFYVHDEERIERDRLEVVDMREHGYCYLRIFLVQFRRVALDKFGFFPNFDQLATADVNMLDQDALLTMRATRVYGDSYHVGGGDVLVADLLFSCGMDLCSLPKLARILHSRVNWYQYHIDDTVTVARYTFRYTTRIWFDVPVFHVVLNGVEHRLDGGIDGFMVPPGSNHMIAVSAPATVKFSVTKTEVNLDGFCYIETMLPERRASAVAVLGSYPTVRDVIQQAKDSERAPVVGGLSSVHVVVDESHSTGLLGSCSPDALVGDMLSDDEVGWLLRFRSAISPDYVGKDAVVWIPTEHEGLHTDVELREVSTGIPIDSTYDWSANLILDAKDWNVLCVPNGMKIYTSESIIGAKGGGTFILYRNHLDIHVSSEGVEQPYRRTLGKLVNLSNYRHNYRSWLVRSRVAVGLSLMMEALMPEVILLVASTSDAILVDDGPLRSIDYNETSDVRDGTTHVYACRSDCVAMSFKRFDHPWSMLVNYRCSLPYNLLVGGCVVVSSFTKLGIGDLTVNLQIQRSGNASSAIVESFLVDWTIDAHLPWEIDRW